MSYKPEYTGRIEGWAVNYCAANAWRVAATMEFEDLLQEAYMTYLKCAMKYAGEIVNGPHFMRLFQTAFRNHVTDLAWSASRCHAEQEAQRGNDAVDWEPTGELENEGHLAVMLRQAPREVQMVLNLVLSAPQEIAEATMMSFRNGNKRRHDGGYGRINAALGLDPQINVMQLVRDYFNS